MSRVTFYGFGAYVGTIKSLTLCQFWDDDPVRIYNFSPSALVEVDLSKNLSAARTGKIAWKDVQVDDNQQSGGLTGIGPFFPTGVMIGPVWLTDSYYGSLPHKPPRQPPSAPNDGYDYEVTSYQYYGGQESDRRFYGFHAKILAVNNGLYQTSVWNAGTGKVGQPAGTWWLDLDHVALQGESIKSGSGPVFLDSATALSLRLAGPKRPPQMGERALP